jgi:hypothetical protein
MAVDEVAEDGDVGAGEDTSSVEVGCPVLPAFDECALEPLVDQHLVAGGGALWFGEFDLHFPFADDGGELQLFHPGKVGQRRCKVKGRKGEFLGWIGVFVRRVLGVSVSGRRAYRKRTATLLVGMHIIDCKWFNNLAFYWDQ